MDDEQPGFSQFCLPSCCPANPDDKIAQVQVPQKIGWMVDDDYTNKEDVVVDEEAIEFNNRDDDDNDIDGNNGSDDSSNDGDNYIEAVATAEKKRKKGKSSTSRKRHKSKGMANTPINHDSVMLSGGVMRILREMQTLRILMTILICSRRSNMKKQKQKIGRSTKMDNQRGRFI